MPSPREIPGESVRQALWPRQPGYDPGTYDAILDSFGVDTTPEREAATEELLSELILELEKDRQGPFTPEEVARIRKEVRKMKEDFRVKRWEEMFVEGPPHA